VAKCVLCNSKSKRFCVILGEPICSYCCGSKRGKEIECLLSCYIYKESLIKSNYFEAIKDAKSHFNNPNEDFFMMDGIPEKAGNFEMYIFEKYYNDRSINDTDLLESYVKIYWILKGSEELYDFKDHEYTIYQQYKHVMDQTNTSLDIQVMLVLRFIRSIVDVTGGLNGHRNYLELLRGMLTKTGQFSGAFSGKG
jgi:hypothetical protein